MAVSARARRLRHLWFQLHKWLGLSLAVVLIPICLTGSALVWHHWVDETLNPDRQTEARPNLTTGFYAEAARRNLTPGERLVSLTMPEGNGPVLATVAKAGAKGGGRPVRTLLYLHPTDGHLLERTGSDQGAVRIMHMIHGTLMIPGVGRQVVGWIGVAMLFSSLSGLWLWWPLNGRVSRAFRWRRSPDLSGRLHHQGGFWIAIPLTVLSLTGTWISFPAFFASIVGEPAGAGQAERMRRMAALPLVYPRLEPSQALALAHPIASGNLRVISWPSVNEGDWKLSFDGEDGLITVVVDDRSGTVTPPEPEQSETTLRLMRRIHDGTGTGTLWQIIIFFGGLIPAALAVTGVLMWWNRRRRRSA
nr:PepSY-associated TM helix domain-containing protein [uncultured Sphingomonas sp.]